MSCAVVSTDLEVARGGRAVLRSVSTAPAGNLGLCLPVSAVAIPEAQGYRASHPPSTGTTAPCT
jgi:hypothetical protein